MASWWDQQGDQSMDERRELGRGLRSTVQRSDHSALTPAPDRPDPIAILEAQGASRQQELLPLRYGRMARSPFAFLRGAAAVMAWDLAHRTPTTAVRVQACGDAHIANFGVFRTPERRIVFDLNDFDETLPAPFEWDVKRMAASIVSMGRTRGFSPAESREAAKAAVRSYREVIASTSRLGTLDVWYSAIDAKLVAEELDKEQRQLLERNLSKAESRTAITDLGKLTEISDGQRRFRSQPPLLEPLDHAERDDVVRTAFEHYRGTLTENRQVLLSRFRPVALARKVVGVGSVGTRCWVLLMEGRNGDPLFLQLKEANASVLEPYAGVSGHPHHGQRVVEGQRLSHAATDIFLGWSGAAKADTPYHYYWRQLRDVKGSANLDRITADNLTAFVRICGQALARAHARTGDPCVLAGYLGSGTAFEEAIARFAERYADQTEQDHRLLVEAIQSGRLPAVQEF